MKRQFRTDVTRCWEQNFLFHLFCWSAGGPMCMQRRPTQKGPLHFGARALWTNSRAADTGLLLAPPPHQHTSGVGGSKLFSDVWPNVTASHPQGLAIHRLPARDWYFMRQKWFLLFTCHSTVITRFSFRQITMNAAANVFRGHCAQSASFA